MWISEDDPHGWPWYLSFRAVGCWLWCVTASVLLGVFYGIGWWFLTAGLMILSTIALAQDPNEP